MKKILFLLLTCILLTSCSRNEPTPNSDILTGGQIKNLMHSGGFEAFDEIIFDSEYALPNKEWVEEVFIPRYRDWMKSQDLWVYAKESNDCDDFTGWARLYAQKLNNETENKGKRALAFGELFYIRDNGEHHAINFVLLKISDNYKILFFEPQTGKSVILSEREMSLITGWIL